MVTTDAQLRMLPKFLVRLILGFSASDLALASSELEQSCVSGYSHLAKMRRPSSQQATSGNQKGKEVKAVLKLRSHDLTIPTGPAQIALQI